MVLTAQQIVGVDSSHLLGKLEKHQKVTRATASHFRKMVSAAQKDGLKIEVISGYRNFQRQLCIWNEKFQGQRPVRSLTGDIINIDSLSEQERIELILLWSALPGTSRHHWGTDLDIIDRQQMPPDYRIQLTPEEFSDRGVCALLNQWLEENAGDFGFFRPYRGKSSGFQEEPWHISYWTEANAILQSFCIEDLEEVIRQQPILGKDTLLKMLPDIFKKYVKSIDTP